MGKNSNPLIGYQYGLGVHMGLCVGPIDKLTQIVCGGKMAWTGAVTASGPININQPDLFGGQHKEGGIVGTATVMMGEPTQAPNAYLQAQLGTPMPAFRGLLTIVYRGLVSAMSPYLKAWSFQVSKWKVGWRTPVWQPSLAKVNEGMNAAHIIYRAITDPVTGLGRDPATLDLTRMLTAAQTLYNEGMGFNFKWSRSDVLANFVQMVCSHAGGDFVDDPTTGLQYLKLYRADYDIGSATLIDESNIIDLQSYEVPALAGSVNEVTVTYHDYTTNKDAAVTVQNLANVQAQGRVVNQSNQYPGIGVAALATRVAMRDLRAQSALPVRIKARVQGTVAVRKGDVLAFSWARLNVSRMAVRVLEVDRGTPTDSANVLTLAQDVYDVPSNAYVVVQPPRWTPPNTTPVPVPDQVLMEASYRDLAANLRPADLVQVAATAGYIGALGDLPPCVATNYKLQTSIDAGSTWKAVASAPFAPSAVLQASMVAEAGPSVTTLISGALLDQVKVPCEVLINNELMRCDALNITTGLVTLARGCVDTVPAAHTAGARVWFADGFTAADPTEYVTGETVQAKLLTQTGSGTLDPGLATTASVTLNSRQIRPYPPAGLKINGAAYPASVIEPLALTWAQRNRVTQADQLIDTTASTITPETGTTYTVRVYMGGVLQSTSTGLTGTSYSPAVTGYGTVRVEIDAVNGSQTSWQPLSATFDYRSALAISGTSISIPNTGTGSVQLQATGGQPPYTWTSGALPAGITLAANGTLTYDGTQSSGTTQCSFTVNSADGQQKTKSIDVEVGAVVGPRYWRVHASNTSGGWNEVAITELVFKDAAGTILTSPGSAADDAFATSVNNAGTSAAAAFDSNVATYWMSLTASSGDGVGKRGAVGWDFGVFGAAIKTVTITGGGGAATGSSNNESPSAFTVETSNDKTTWTVAGSFTSTGWAAAETRTFALP